MPTLDDVVKNWGDFDNSRQWRANFGGIQEGALRGRSEQFGDFGNAYRDTQFIGESGMRSAGTNLQLYKQRIGRKGYERKMIEAAGIIYRGFNGSRRDMLI